MNHRTRPFVRMQENGAFGGILEAALRAMPGCIAVAFVDQEGEAVDAVGWAEEFDIKVAGAHLRIMLEVAQSAHLGATQDLLISATHLSYRVRAMAEGYALVFLFIRDAAFIASQRATDVCIHALSREAGFDIQGKPAWFPVEVVAHGALTKPRRVRGQGAWYEVEVLGVMVGVGLAHRERGYRVRLANGNEATLLREPLGRWWSDTPIE
jgi:hypothetical protein